MRKSTTHFYVVQKVNLASSGEDLEEDRARDDRKETEKLNWVGSVEGEKSRQER